jgi:hypothetical protein
MGKDSSDSNFFQKLFGQIFGKDDPETEKKRQLKSIAKDLSRTHYKFYRAGPNEVLPSLGKFFYDVYKAVSPAQILFQTIENPAYFKNVVIDTSLSDQQKTIADELSEESITTQASNMPINQLTEKLKIDTETFMNEFDMEKINRTDALYTKLMAFKAFCLYDYYFMLKKFDSTLREREFNGQPRFEAINATYIADDLKDFLAIAWALPFDDDWSDVMQLFRTIKGVEPIKPALWAKILSKLKMLRDSNVFEMMIQLISKDPSYHTTFEIKSEHVVEPYLDKMRSQVTLSLKKLESQQKNSKVDSLLMQIFNTNVVLRLKNYSEQASGVYEKKNLGSFEYHRPLNYLKAFLIEFVKRDVREYADLVLVRGKWTTAALSAPMSDAYHALLDTSDAITAFDEKLGEDGDLGLKLKTLLPRSERDKEAVNIIKTTLKDVNTQANAYVYDSTKNLIIFAKNVKALLDDHQKTHGEMIINWKEIDHFAEHPTQQLGIEIYKKIYLFANLMQNFLSQTPQQ